jgi:hypothetical protein
MHLSSGLGKIASQEPDASGETGEKRRKKEA